MEMRLKELDPYKRSEYQRLMSENNDLMTEYSKKQNQMEELLSKLANS